MTNPEIDHQILTIRRLPQLIDELNNMPIPQLRAWFKVNSDDVLLIFWYLVSRAKLDKKGGDAIQDKTDNGSNGGGVAQATKIKKG